MRTHGEAFTFLSIGAIRSPYPERFGIPRQPGLVPSATCEIALPLDSANAARVRGLEGFSHLWVLFVFHRNRGEAPATVRPPRLGGTERRGVYATRSPDRPNPIGLSVVPLEAVETRGKEIVLTVRGGDFLDGTPVLDLKPYLPGIEAIAAAEGGWTDRAAATEVRIQWDPSARARAEAASLVTLVEETLRADPRPASQRGETAAFGFRIRRWNVRFRAVSEQAGRVTFVVGEIEEDRAMGQNIPASPSSRPKRAR